MRDHFEATLLGAATDAGATFCLVRRVLAGWMTPLMTLAFLMLGTPLTHEGRLGEGPAVAPRRYRWTVVRLTADCPAFRSRL